MVAVAAERLLPLVRWEVFSLEQMAVAVLLVLPVLPGQQLWPALRVLQV
jgi:hypothetical protein